MVNNVTRRLTHSVAKNPIVNGQESAQPTGELPPLFPDRMEQGDFFVCDIFDALPKSDMASMEHPIYSIQTRPDTRPRAYKNGGVLVTVSPHPEHGLPTVHDKDILIFAISQLVAGMRAGRTPTRTITLSAYDILTATNRGTGGSDYAKLRKALRRLASTTINTNIVTGKRTTESEFSLIDDWGSVRETVSGRLIELTVTLNDWVFRAIMNHEVLSLHRDYFRLRSPLDRRLYELARKHCGKQETWECGLDKLRDKVGAASELKVFRHAIRKTVARSKAHAHLPDYALDYDPERDVLIVSKRETTPPLLASSLVLSADAIEEAKHRAAGFDVYSIEASWRGWIAARPDRRFPKRNADAHFLRYVETHVARLRLGER